jgi:hypothetical protein
MDPYEFQRVAGIPVIRLAIGDAVDPACNAAAKAIFEHEVARARGAERAQLATFLATIYEQEGNTEGALSLLEQAVEDSPAEIRHAAMLGHAQVLLNRGDVVEGLIECDTLLAYVESQRDYLRDLKLSALCAEMLRKYDPERALAWVESGLRLLLRMGGDLDDARDLFHEYRSSVASCPGRKVDQNLVTRVDWFLNEIGAEAHSDPIGRAVLGYFPSAAFENPEDRQIAEAVGFTDAEGQKIAIERCFRLEISPSISKYIATIDTAGLRAYARQHDLPPSSGAAVKLYSAKLVRDNRATRWPPERNAPCWCGSETKYKKCCGAAYLLAPDEAALREYQIRTGEGWKYP